MSLLDPIHFRSTTVVFLANGSGGQVKTGASHRRQASLDVEEQERFDASEALRDARPYQRALGDGCGLYLPRGNAGGHVLDQPTKCAP